MPEIKELVERFVIRRQRLASMLEDSKKESNAIAELSAKIIGHMEGNGIATLESEDGYKIGKSAKTTPQIEDDLAFEAWAIEEGNAFVEANWDTLQRKYDLKKTVPQLIVEKPNFTLCKAIAQHFIELAHNQGKEPYDLMPPGLSYTKGDPFLTLRKPKQDKKTVPVPANSLLEMAKAGYKEKE